MSLKKWLRRVLICGSPKPMSRSRPVFPIRFVELLESRDAPATLSAGNVAGDLLIADTAGVVNLLTMSVDAGNLVISDAAEQFSGTGGFAGASLSNGDKTLSIPLTSLAGANVSIDGAAGNDTLTINALPGFASGLTIGSLAHPLASVTFAGAVSLPAGKDLSVWGGTIAVSGPVSTAGGAITVSATNDITIFTRSGAFVGGSLNAGSGAIAITAAAVQPKKTAANEIAAATTSFAIGTDLKIAITTGTTFDTLNVAGTVDLSGVDLVLTGLYSPFAGDNFTIVSATTRSGFFNNLPNGSMLVFNGSLLRINYTATAVTLAPLVPRPTITSITPIAGPTTGGTRVIITGTGFIGTTSVTFGGTNAASFAVMSNRTIEAVTPAHAAGIVDVIVTSNGSDSISQHFEYLAAAPKFGSFTVNGGDMYAINRHGVKVTGLAGNNSIIEQLYVTFDVGVTLGAGAFTLDAGPVTVSIPAGASPVAAGTNVVTILAEADPATLDGNGGYKGYRLRFSGSAAYLNTFDNSATGNGGSGNLFTTLKDGFYKLNIVGANVHAGSSIAGTPMASNVTKSFWTMFASYAPDDRDVAGEGHSGTPGDGTSIISVNASLVDFAQSNGFGYGTSLTGPLGQAYNANFDWNLDGDVGDDLIEFAKRFGAQWSF
jgi:hypothetical protein